MDALQQSLPFQPYLFTGERLLWSGKPKQGLALGGRDTLLIPFSLMWGGFAVFWNASVWGTFDGNEAAPVFFRLWGLPFLFAGLYFIIGRFFHDASIRKNLSYAVTDQRILVLRKSKITSLDIHRLPRLEFSEHRDHTGTLTFEAASSGPWGGGMNGFGWWVPSLGAATQFFRIENPRRVYEIVRNQGHT